MTRTLIMLSTLALIACGSRALPETSPGPENGPQFIEQVTADGDEIVIPYTKYELPNGLTVVLHPDDSDPLVHVDVTYHVGSGREEPGKSGFAHFFEHMMFQGSENVADEQHFKIITESGGTLNGTTNTDRTNYFQTVPSNQLEKMLWLEADRMGFLLDAVTQEKFEVQRETVKNERGQRIDNAPYGLLGERVGEAMYPEGHPYSWSVIGYLVDLDRADVNDLKRFFLRWYGPNNAVLTIGGRFDEAEALAWTEKYFGPIPPGPEVQPPVYEEVTLDKDRYISLEDNVALPLVYMAWPTVHLRHPDEAPLDVLMSILGDGKTSLLYKNLLKDGTAVQAGANHGCSELHCTFTLLALPNPERGKNLADIEAVLRASLAEFEERGVRDEDIEKVKAGIVSQMVFGLESVGGKVSSLAAYETYEGSPNGIGKDIARYNGVTKEDVQRVYKQYLVDKPAVIMSIVPKGKTEIIAHEDTWERYEREIPESAPANELALRRAEDTFDRSVKPPSGDNPTIKPPTTWNSELENGIKVLGALNDETPTTAMWIRLDVGQHQESLDKLGLANLTAQMLGEATAKSTNEELSNRLDKLGSNISITSGESTTAITIQSLTKNLDETIAIAAERLLEPKFDSEDFERLKANTLQEIEVARTEPEVTADAAFKKLLYGEKNAFSHPNMGSTKSVESLTLDDVKAFYKQHYNASVTHVVAVSSLDQAAFTEKLAPLKAMATGEKTEAELLPMPELAGGTLYLIDKPDAAQSQFRMGTRALPFDATGEYYKSKLMNYPLGGAFNSRININLREDKGYTYGARATFSGDQHVGWYRAAAGVRSDATAASIVEFVKEIDAFQTEGIKAEELAFTKNSIGQRDARSYETPRQKLRFLGNLLTYDLPADFVDEQASILASIEKAELDALAAKHLLTGEMIMVVVGDSAKIRPLLEELGYPIIELDTDGQPVP
jgi:zinc protease